jgi:hypothetical protein
MLNLRPSIWLSLIDVIHIKGSSVHVLGGKRGAGIGTGSAWFNRAPFALALWKRGGVLVS